MATKAEALKISIARYAVLFGVRMRKMNGAELQKLTAAVSLLNQAQAVVDVSENEAKKLLALARNIASQGAKDESKKPGA